MTVGPTIVYVYSALLYTSTTVVQRTLTFMNYLDMICYPGYLSVTRKELTAVSLRCGPVALRDLKLGVAGWVKLHMYTVIRPQQRKENLER